ncbi:hypothetical protein SAMN02746089_00951 [Caldanaerobius fijiensis DSM 17918]|uniref:Uncharacterized protein n=1 Tax=Caldanaerobius fijiensis DSM 17918 TaxID=1121256 RepID=A0A1M4X681_9THEO|nr:hypothetical protein [Caldanaerobius fijiensis]SHE88642.1 hypothetical protein SAMN02746089_00951 [Caldanaerobius fijiensis DSM 17918]
MGVLWDFNALAYKNDEERSKIIYKYMTHGKKLALLIEKLNKKSIENKKGVLIEKLSSL